jgi:biopolymer transport protein ExbD
MLPACIAAASLFLTPCISAGSEPVFLRDPSQPQGKGEGILLFIAADGKLHADSGPTNENALERTFKQWRAQGTEPAIRLILFPALKSNSDLKRVRGIIDFLRAHRVFYDVVLDSVDATPDESLR